MSRPIKAAIGGCSFGILLLLCGIRIVEWQWWALVVVFATYGALMRE